METKICSKCGETKPLDRFSKGRNQCRDCRNADKRAWYEKNPEKQAAFNKKWYENNRERAIATNKIWHENNTEKVAAYKKTWRENNKESITVYREVYRKNNKESIVATRKIYLEKNKESIAASRKIYRENNKESIALRNKIWYKNNIEKKLATSKIWYDSNKERVAENHKRWKKNNPEKCKLYDHKRRAMLIGATATLTDEEWSEVWQEFDGKCFWCGDVATTMEHIVPLNPRSGDLQGHHTKGNVVPACSPCNSSKNNMDPLKFYFKQQKMHKVEGAEL